MREKSFKKWICMTLICSMLLGTSGCAMLFQNMWQEENQEEVLPEVQKEASNEAAKSQTTGKTDKKETSATTEEQDTLMTEQFTNKMEMLKYLTDMYYMNDVSVEAMQNGAYKGLMEGLGDPYTCYYTADEYKDLMQSTEGTYYGIGAVVQQDLKTMYITVVKPYVDGPAYKAGMLPGDIIYMVDGVDVTGMEVDKVVTLMKGPEGTIVKVSVVREGEADPVELTITRAKIEIESIEYEMLDYNIGLVTVSSFDEPTPKQFKEAIEKLKSQGMKGLVIDLRNNPGGLLDAVVEMLDYILPQGLIVYMEDKYGNREEYIGQDNNILDMPITVLINGNSASASEIFAAAMQDYAAATIIGTTSYGKGIVQSVIPLNDGTAVKMTIARYFTPNGVCIHGIGVTPDKKVELDEELKQMVVIPHDKDNQLKIALEILVKEIY